MSAVIAALMALLSALQPATAATSVIEKIISLLVQLIPVLVKEYQDVLPMVKNIIGALQSNNTVTDDQMAQLEKLDQQVDEAFEAAATNAQAEDQDD